MTKRTKRSPWLIPVICILLVMALGTVAIAFGRLGSYFHKIESKAYSPLNGPVSVDPVHSGFTGTKIFGEDFDRTISWVDSAGSGISERSSAGFVYHLGSDFTTDDDNLSLYQGAGYWEKAIIPFAIINNEANVYSSDLLYTVDFDVELSDNYPYQITFGMDFTDSNNKESTKIGNSLAFIKGAFYFNGDKLIDYDSNKFHLTLVMENYDLHYYLNGYHLTTAIDYCSNLTGHTRGMRVTVNYSFDYDEDVYVLIDNVALYSFVPDSSAALVEILSDKSLNLQRCKDSLLYGGK